MMAKSRVNDVLKPKNVVMVLKVVGVDVAL